ncbi:TetR/AcrR family transcriptional regulator [Catenulispora rubra]|uniref:TetR/AcrR family transcriptional regulator n=1 Tax=Catenulispora rubra TaxID=280293 RepID=UPI0018921C34|nr:TetR/AcrR family transcriptional regulator [Catenulispora rubra]
MTNAKTEVATPVAAPNPPPARPLRRDAERNRQLILDTAKTVFAHRGLDASLDEVAHEAGLGVGTVYRRFPNRDALIDALFADMLTSIERIVAESMALPRAWDGLVHFMTAMLESQGRDKALRDLMLSRQKYLEQCEVDKEEVVRETVEPALYEMIDRAQIEGDLRPDVVATDVGVLLISAVGVVDFTAPADPEVWRRHLAVMLDGLRARAAGDTFALAPEPLDDDQLEVCMTGWKYGTRDTPRRRS